MCHCHNAVDVRSRRNVRSFPTISTTLYNFASKTLARASWLELRICSDKWRIVQPGNHNYTTITHITTQLQILQHNYTFELQLHTLQHNFIPNVFSPCAIFPSPSKAVLFMLMHTIIIVVWEGQNLCARKF